MFPLLFPQAFTVVTVFNAMTFALKVTPFSVKSLSEASVAVERFKVWHTSLLSPLLSSPLLSFPFLPTPRDRERTREGRNINGGMGG